MLQAALQSPRPALALRPVLFCLLALLPALLLFAPLRAGAEERITSFDSEIQIAPDGRLVVTERIRLVSEGEQIQRGIVRSFPLRYTEPDGKWHPVGFELLEVQRDGRPEPYREEPLGEIVDIYIGSPDVFIGAGEHSYLLRYSTNRQISFLQGYDELYFNITGNEWQLPILSASARIMLPQPVPAEQLHIEGYTGFRGSQGQDYRAAISRPGEGLINSTRRFEAGEGLTVVFQWPSGIIAPPTAEQLAYEQELRDAEARALAEQAEWDRQYQLRQEEQRRRDKRLLEYICYGAVGVLALLFLVSWLSVGIDPARADPALLRQPPQDVSPAALRYIRQMKYDGMCFTTAVVSLAAKGYLRINQDKEGDYSLQRLKSADDSLPAEEKRLHEEVFSGASSRKLSSNSTHFIKATNALQAALKKRYEKGYFHSNEAWKQTGACLSCLLSCGVLMFGIGSSVLFLTPAPFVAVVALVALNWAYARLVPRYSSQGRMILDQFEPLREALSGGKPIESLMPSSAPMSPALFSQFLPYALAMDLQAAWAQQLEQQLKTAAQKAPPPPPGAVLQEQPGYYSGIDWYYNPYRRSYRYDQLVSNLSQNFNRKLSIASAPVVVSSGGSSGGSSRSWSGSSFSGGGGGGFSGGGGGGGGGRGW
ncbi:DUF2207 domain-containing protein [bacterium]|nr:DUF2207 domain-containing protein [bacterium]